MSHMLGKGMGREKGGRARASGEAGDKPSKGKSSPYWFDAIGRARNIRRLEIGALFDAVATDEPGTSLAAASNT